MRLDHRFELEPRFDAGVPTEPLLNVGWEDDRPISPITPQRLAEVQNRLLLLEFTLEQIGMLINGEDVRGKTLESLHIGLDEALAVLLFQVSVQANDLLPGEKEALRTVVPYLNK